MTLAMDEDLALLAIACTVSIKIGVAVRISVMFLCQSA